MLLFEYVFKISRFFFEFFGLVILCKKFKLILDFWIRLVLGFLKGVKLFYRLEVESLGEK